ncbi:MAG: TadE/TadG family type IV pilus assembly protein [Anaerolineae bacterium]
MGRSHIARHRQRGQELVEFALILPLLLLLMVGIFEFGYVVFAYNTLSNAVREGARYGSVHPESTDAIIERAERLTTGLDGDELTWDVVGSADDDEPSETRISVSVTYQHHLMTGFIFQPFGIGEDGTIPLTASSSMGIE